MARTQLVDDYYWTSRATSSGGASSSISKHRTSPNRPHTLHRSPAKGDNTDAMADPRQYYEQLQKNLQKMQQQGARYGERGNQIHLRDELLSVLK